MDTRKVAGHTWTRTTNRRDYGPPAYWTSDNCSIPVGDREDKRPPTGGRYTVGSHVQGSPRFCDTFQKAARRAIKLHEQKLEEAREFVEKWG